ncbi:MAG: hypothetical protein LUJ25_04585 [Firmicutes bacterium]|nr:hypothetical protein [Bacillota bacterium]
MARSKAQAVSNEEIIAAILANGTIAAAAAACGITARTIYDRMKDADFRAEYAAAKNEVIRGAVYNLNAQLSEAVNVIAQIMTDTNNNAAVRLQAAQTILNNAGKLSDRLTKDEKNAREENSSIMKMFDDLF